VPGRICRCKSTMGSNPFVAGAITHVLGATLFAVPAVGTVMRWPKPGLPFNNGLQIVLAGTTAGEIAVEWS
jgi:hypothetical protein